MNFPSAKIPQMRQNILVHVYCLISHRVALQSCILLGQSGVCVEWQLLLQWYHCSLIPWGRQFRVFLLFSKMDIISSHFTCLGTVEKYSSLRGNVCQNIALSFFGKVRWSLKTIVSTCDQGWSSLFCGEYKHPFCLIVPSIELCILQRDGHLDRAPNTTLSIPMSIWVDLDAHFKQNQTMRSY